MPESTVASTPMETMTPAATEAPATETTTEASPTP
jgi:hypothetical protein